MNDHRNMLRTALKSCNVLTISLIHNTLLLHDILEAAYDAARGDLQREDLPPTHAATVYPRALHVLLPLQNAAKRVFTRKISFDTAENEPSDPAQVILDPAQAI